MTLNHLKRVREERQLAIRGLTARCRVSPTTISAVERWGYEPAPETRERLAAALDCSVSDIWPDIGQTEDGHELCTTG